MHDNSPTLLFKRFCALSLFFCLAAAGFSQPVLQQIEIAGNKHFSQRKIIAWSGLQVGQRYTPETAETAAEKILRELTAQGYYFCSVDSIASLWNADSSEVRLTIHLREGERLILKEVSLAGDRGGRAGDFLLFSPVGKPFLAQNLEADFWNLLDSVQESGHPFARLDLKRLGLQHDSLAVEVKLISGPEATVTDVQIAGLEHTKARVVAREARLVPDQKYRPSWAEKARQRIGKLPFIAEVAPPVLIPQGSGRYNVLFSVKEARSNSFDGVMGYQPAANGQEGQVIGLLDLSFLNLFGTARQVKVHWERLSPYWQAIDLFYEEPWVAGWPFNLWGEFQQEIQDTLYLTRRFSGGISWPALDILSLDGSLFQEEVLPDSAGRSYLGLYRSRSWGGALELNYDTRDYPENPTRGIHYHSYVAAAQKKYEPAANRGILDVRKYETDVDWSFPLTARHILNLQVHGRMMQSDEQVIPQPDLYRLGGARTLRGYREDQFLGHIVSWGSLEYRLWVDKLSRIYAFFNLGYYQHEFESPPASGAIVRQQDWPWGYGLGFRQGTRLGIIGFDFALGEDDVLATAKIHFRLINRF